MVTKKGKLTTPPIDDHEALTFHELDAKPVFEEPETIEPTPEPEKPVKKVYTRDEAIHTIASFESEGLTASQVYEMLVGSTMPLPFKTNAVLARILAEWLGVDEVQVHSTTDCVKRWFVSAESRV
jgi:hypothetical protein